MSRSCDISGADEGDHRTGSGRRQPNSTQIRLILARPAFFRLYAAAQAEAGSAGIPHCDREKPCPSHRKVRKCPIFRRRTPIMMGSCQTDIRCRLIMTTTLSATDVSARQIIDSSSIVTFFQPILSARQRSVVGAEALSRGLVGVEAMTRGSASARDRTGTIIPPVDLFRMAASEGLLLELDRLCRDTAIRSFAQLPRHEENWEIWLGEDDANGRPDPTTGQIGPHRTLSRLHQPDLGTAAGTSGRLKLRSDSACPILVCQSFERFPTMVPPWSSRR